MKQDGDVIFSLDKLRNLQYGLIIGGKHSLESLLRLMNRVYGPNVLTNPSWPQSVKLDLSAQLHKFMASLTETSHLANGHTILYLPEENISETAIKDKDQMQRLEAILIHWTRQIKEVVNNQKSSSQLDAAGPLHEIEFWRSRCVDLSGIRSQLERPGVKAIVSLLKQVNSTYLADFLTLSSGIQQGSIEANENLKLLV